MAGLSLSRARLGLKRAVGSIRRSFDGRRRIGRAVRPVVDALEKRLLMYTYSGTVWLDTDDDGNFDAGEETGIPEISVNFTGTIFGRNGAPDTQFSHDITTNAAGYWEKEIPGVLHTDWGYESWTFNWPDRQSGNWDSANYQGFDDETGVVVWEPNQDVLLTAIGLKLEPAERSCGCNGTSKRPVRYADGQMVETAVDLVSPGFSMPWSHSRAWSNLGDLAGSNLNGNGWGSNEMPYIVRQIDGYGPDVGVVFGPTNVSWFDGNFTGAFTTRHGRQDGVVYGIADDASGDNEYTYTAPDGSQYRFFDFDPLLPDYQKGAFKSFTDPSGNRISAFSHDSNGRVTELRRSVSQSSVTTIESWQYGYLTSGDNAGKLDSVLLRRGVDTGTGINWSTVREVEYTYYTGAASGEYSFGELGDLRSATTKDAGNNVLDTWYYRYYRSGEGAFAGALKYVFDPEQFARLAGAVSNPLTTTNTAVAAYASRAYSYDGNRRVTQEIVAASGSNQSGGDGRGTIQYSYTSSENARGYNSWAMKTVETLADGNQNIVYTNYLGLVMLHAYVDMSFGQSFSDKTLATFYHYDAAGRLDLTAHPSAFEPDSGGNLWNDSFADLLNDQGGGDYEYLGDSFGQVDITAYATSTTADHDTAGDVTGLPVANYTQRGDTGTPILISETQYYEKTYTPSGTGGVPSVVRPVASETVYPDAVAGTPGTGRTTDYLYDWHEVSSVDTNLVKSIETRLPVVSTTANGPGGSTRDTSFVFFDSLGNPVWSKDAEGYINYVAYDFVTGAVTKTITNVDTSQTSTFANLPGGWSSSGLHLTATMTPDALGRTTKLVDPKGNVTHWVYKDAEHEVRTYQGWDATTHTTTGPILVSRTYRPAANAPSGQRTLYYESLTSTAAPSFNNTTNEPTGTETLTAGNITSLSRTLTNNTGQVTDVHEYFTLSGLTYSVANPVLLTSTSPPVAATASNDSSTGHYYRTQYAYNAAGLVNRTRNAAGTIYRTVWDGRGNAVSEWVGTNDTSATDFDPTGGSASGNNMTKVSEAEYDESCGCPSSSGDGNITKLTLYPGGTAAPRVTEYHYDWRSRLVAVKTGVQTTETTDVQRQITYYDLNNLGQVTATSLYDGDNVTITETNSVPNKPSSSLLRGKTTVSYDEQLRPYRSSVFSVDPANGTVSSDSLDTDVWYDRRGNVIKTAGPGGVVNKNTYNGVGWITAAYASDGGGDSGWSDADDVYGDKVLEQLAYTYDANGNVILTAAKQRFHNENATGGLIDASTSPKARVYYSAAYYDAINRLTDSVNVGTNGGSPFNRPSSAPVLSGAGFESPDLGSGGPAYQYQPSGTGWTLSPGAGVTGNGSGFTASNPNAPEGDQALLLQAAASATQSVSNWQAGTYRIEFLAAQRLNHQDAQQDFEVYIDSTLVGYYTPSSGNYTSLTTAPFTVSAGTHTIEFRSLNTAGGDNTIFIDDVRIVPAAPARSDTALVTSYGYDAAGYLQNVTDPRGNVTRSNYDLLGQLTSVTEAYTDGTPSAADDRITRYTYDGIGNVLTMTADLPGTDQTTQYVYGVTIGSGNLIASNDLLKEVRYPNASTGLAGTATSDKVQYAYNAIGDAIKTTDKNGNVHEYTYDVLGRSLTDAVTTLGSGVDGTVRRLATTYNTQGLPEKFTSYSAASGGSVVNEVQRAYNGLGQIVTEYQAHTGAVNTGSTPKVQYAYTEMASGANHSRLKSMTYPNGRVLRYEYTSGLDSDISRISYLADDASGSVGTHLEEYSYLGLGTIVGKNRPEPGVELTYLKQGVEPNGDAGDQYAGLDRFGRIVDQRWMKTSDGSHTDRFQYGYDRNSNPLYKDNKLQSSMSELYQANSGTSGDNNTAYDKLNRLTDFRRGTLSSSGNNGTGLDTVTTASRTQGWSLDALGNVSSVTTDNDEVLWTHNSKNQITMTGDGSVSYDSSGNTTEHHTFGATSSGFRTEHLYDAWNRLVESTVDQQLDGFDAEVRSISQSYDALNRRIRFTHDNVINDTEPESYWVYGGTNNLYYSLAWQVIEDHATSYVTQWDSGINEVTTTNSSSKSQNVWSLVYIDNLLLRDKDADGSSGTGNLGESGSGLEQRLYAQQDANHNITALVNTSGAVVQRFVYDPYGVSTALTASWTSTTDAYNWHYRHQGTRWESEIGLYDVRNRFYSPTLMRWMQEDPAGYVDGANFYTAYNGSPTSGTDPFGLTHDREHDAVLDRAMRRAIAPDARTQLGLRIAASTYALLQKRQQLEAVALAAHESWQRSIGVAIHFSCPPDHSQDLEAIDARLREFDLAWRRLNFDKTGLRVQYSRGGGDVGIIDAVTLPDAVELTGSLLNDFSSGLQSTDGPFSLLIGPGALRNILKLASSKALEDAGTRVLLPAVTTGAPRVGTLTFLVRGTGKEGFKPIEINAAQVMTWRGYDVILRTPVGTRADGGTCDLFLNGVRSEIYTPTTSNHNAIISTLFGKNSQLPGGGSVVLDLRLSNASSKDLGDIMKRLQNAARKKNIVLNIREVHIIE